MAIFNKSITLGAGLGYSTAGCVNPIGRIDVPDIPASGTFPFTTDYPHGTVDSPTVWVHDFESGNHKISQRFLRGSGARVHTFQRQLSITDIATLKTFWEARKGAYEPFSYDAYLDGHSGSPTTLTVRFSNPAITFEQLSQAISSVGINFIEEVTSGVTHALTKTLTRFPDVALETALESQVQSLIPLIRIRVREAAVADIFLSDRRVTIGGQLYVARLIRWTEITQGINGESDSATFEFGNADRVMVDLMNDTNLLNATVEFSLFHVSETTKVDLWSGEIVNVQSNAGPVFVVTCGDPLRQLSLSYPTRTFNRECWKEFDDGNACPYTAQGSGGDPVFCDKGFATAKGCTSHTMADFFGGIKVDSQKVRIKDNSQGFWGLGRPTITVASILSDSVYGRGLAQHYTDVDMHVAAEIVAGSDESDFYHALAVVGEGPIGSYASDTTKHRLDQQSNHGSTESPPSLNGLDLSLGADPNPDEFSFGQGQAHTADRVAGVAFIEIKRTDAVGRQMNQLVEHSVEAVVATGMTGFTWTAPGSRTSGVTLVNPVWVLINALIRVNNLQFAVAAAQESLFDVAAAVTAAAICDTVVTKEVGSGSQKQYRFIGSLRQRKPFRDWAIEILNNCLGYFTFNFGKMKIGIRNDSSAIEAYTTGNIILDSLEFSLVRPGFNHLMSHFGNESMKFGADSVTFYEESHAQNVTGVPGNPKYEKMDLNLVGTSTRDQAFRIVVARLREEVGGITLANFRDHRDFSFRATVLSLGTDPGQVISITHADAPGGVIEGRVRSWTLHEDFSVSISGRTTVDAMYDLTVGPKPDDVEPDAIPAELIADLLPPIVTALSASEDAFVEQDGTVRSSVTVTYNEPSPLGTFKGVAIYLARLNTDLVNDSGAMTEEPHEVTRIYQNAAPETRRFLHDALPVVAGVSGAVRLFAVSFSGVSMRDVETSPATDVLLDGKDSPPTAVADLWCQTGVIDGLRLTWDENPERDIRGYQVADCGDITPLADTVVIGATNASPIVIETSAAHGYATGERVETRHILGNQAANAVATIIVTDATHFSLDGTTGDGNYVSGGDCSQITSSQVIASFPANPNEDRAQFDFKEKLYRGNSDGTVITLDSDVTAKLFPVQAHVVGASGKNIQFFETDGSVSNFPVVSNTARTITFAAGTVPTGEVKFYIRGSNGEHKLYVRAIDLSGHRSLWRPIPPVVLSCVPFAGDATRDIEPPTMYLGIPFTGGIDRTTWRPGWLQSLPGTLWLRFMAISALPDAETDVDVALKLNINGITHWEVELTDEADVITRYEFPASAGKENFKFNPIIPVTRPDPFWTLRNDFTLSLNDFAIKNVRQRAKNFHGWGAWLDADGFTLPPGAIQYTGNGTIEEPISQSSIVGNLDPNILRSSAVDSTLTETTTIRQAEYLGDGTPGTGDVPVLGHVFTVSVLQPPSGTTFDATFNSEYKGLAGKPVDRRHNYYTAWTFRVQGTSPREFRCIGWFSALNT